MQLSRFPRVRLCHAPTPLEPMSRLSEALGGPEIWVKRDDCTGLASGGNKTRKLEFLIGAALAAGADHVITQGAHQSNHVRQTAAAAAKHGLKCTALLEQRVETNDPDYLGNGNILLDELMGCTLRTYPAGTDMQAEMDALAADLKDMGDTPYVIPGGGSNTTGALGYVACAYEMLGQADAMGLAIDHIVTATGSTGTQAGLVAGLTAANAGIPVLGISVRAPKEKQEANVLALTRATAEVLGYAGDIDAALIEADDTQVGGGYGVPTPAMIEAVRMFSSLEGILLDPVYSGKGAAGLIAAVRAGRFTKGQKVVFLHTGGSAGLFAYRSTFMQEAIPAC
ncbi:D-cysteine desulfhydrase [Pseudooceanicola nanhaiensis]|uniref:D-cysteine desulfhydrase n=1 Tax=Pseudooceanicola nanhaiensis TaxID=375761 RepID=UPI001CD3789C|nr:D-cysteine desulfhydrase [Pseudooceanicola nanhaiensis]MCA0921546.1 D-cysteine desulfhydrase [Pseudooceanicola nanhaiensis]